MNSTNEYGNIRTAEDSSQSVICAVKVLISWKCTRLQHGYNGQL